MKLDLKYRREQNARVGIALASKMKAGVFAEEKNVLTQLSKGWIDAYIAWNFAFVYTSTSAIDKIVKLLIPSISCTDDHVRERWGQRRIISLSLGLLHTYALIGNTGGQHTTIPQTDALILDEFYSNMRSVHSKLSEEEIRDNTLASALGGGVIWNILISLNQIEILCKR